MILSLGCLAAAFAILLLAPRILTAGRWQVGRPRLALTAWFCSFFLGIGCALASIVAAIAAAVGTRPADDAALGLVLTLGGWLSLGLIGALIALVAASAEPLARSWHTSVGKVAPVAVSREERRDVALVWFSSEEPMACAVPSRRPEIFLATALRELLSTPQLEAVIAHERAHLRQHHAGAVRIAEINALCVPHALRGGRALKRATLLLVELIADDAAATQAGAVHLANALAVMGRATGDPGLLLRAERLTLRRWPLRRTRRRMASVPA